MPTTFRIKGSVFEGGNRLRWKPVPRARAYQIEWLDKNRKWAVLDDLEGDDAAPNDDGFIVFVDQSPAPVAAGDTYRVAAYFDANFECERVVSPPVRGTEPRQALPARDALSKRLQRNKWPRRVKAIVSRIKRRRRGWALLLPPEAGRCLGKRVEVVVRREALDDEILDMLALILENLPKLAARAEKAFLDYGGLNVREEADQIHRPQIEIDGPRVEGRLLARGL